MIEYINRCLLIREENRKIIVIGDLHLGYEEQMQTTGVFVFRRQLKEVINLLEQIFEAVSLVDEIVLLGDVKHNFGKITKQEWQDISFLFDYLKEKTERISVIRGNHDSVLGPIAKKKNVALKEYYIIGSYCFLHGNKDFAEIYNKEIKHWIIGHGHPAVAISDGIKTEKYKCFLVGKYMKKEVIIVPSFFSYFAGSDPRKNDLNLAWNFNLEKFEVEVVQDNNLEVLSFGKLKDLK
jgi:uncharacterized protein